MLEHLLLGNIISDKLDDPFVQEYKEWSQGRKQLMATYRETQEAEFNKMVNDILIPILMEGREGPIFRSLRANDSDIGLAILKDLGWKWKQSELKEKKS